MVPVLCYSFRLVPDSMMSRVQSSIGKGFNYILRQRIVEKICQPTHINKTARKVAMKVARKVAW